jgi:hypothetical protein
MLCFPDAQKRAQEELDAVVGRSRMPTFADYNSLPYLRALIKETLRWMPVDPIGMPCPSEVNFRADVDFLRRTPASAHRGTVSKSERQQY